MIVCLLTTGCSVCCLIGMAWLCHNINKQTEHTEIMVGAMYAQLQMLKFISDAEASNLWKIRQEVYNWQCEWTAKEEYEAAQQAKIMVEHIEKLINSHSKIVKDNENNKRTNG